MHKRRQVFRLLSGKNYHRHLLDSINSAERRVVLVTMSFAIGPLTEEILVAVEGALSRGVKVQLIADEYSRLFILRLRSIGILHNLNRLKRSRNAFIKLNSLGAEASFIGHLGVNPFRGRMHAKFTVVDNTVFSFGGINFNDEAFSYNDYMLVTSDKALADRLCSQAGEISKNIPGDDRQYAIDKHNKLLIDGGIPGRSLIYDTVCKLAEEAQTIYCTSQMCPSGEFAKILKKKRNFCYFNSVRKTPFPTNLSILLDSIRFGVKNKYVRPAYMHAKCVLFIDKNGKKQLVTGSHNFSWRGVAYGTKEIALYSEDPSMWQLLFNYIQEEVA